jgi:hypothetical protein
MILFLAACGPPSVELWVSVEGESVDIEWAEVTLRPEGLDWDSPWEQMKPETLSHSLEDGGKMQLLATAVPEAESYLQVFPDADAVYAAGVSVADIIEPIAAPFHARGKRRIYLELIVLDKGEGPMIFAMDTEVRP